GDPQEPGIDGGMALRSQSMGSTITVGVTSVDESIAKVVAAGGKILMPKNPIPGVGYFASCQDSEGNAFGIMETDMDAK
ncbi:MAG: VOC family protein, partial [bacterium]